MKSKIFHLLVRFYATVGGLGYVKRGSATAGAVAGALIFYLIQPLHISVAVALLVMAFILGVFSSSIISTKEKMNDPQFIIIDEVVGCWVTLLFIPKSIVAFIAGVLLFRIFDKTKILGIRKLEGISGGWGIMLDDILAGVYANIALQILMVGYARIA